MKILKKHTYSDGDNIENFLLKFFQSNPSEKDIENVLSSNTEWAIKYHLSKDRENLLNWYSFKKGSKLVEIGAGCGAVTGAFLEQDVEVTAVELSKRRADIIRNRFKHRKNLTVFDGNIHEQKLKEKYDYATLIGVLEYAGRFSDGENPFKKMLEDTKRLLKKDGILIIAIENKLGLKYWRGAPEDHTNRLFDSLQDYPDYDGIRTFSRKELKEMLEDSGYKNVQFYYPLPDYKFCYEIFSDNYLPSKNHRIASSIFPSPHPSESFYLFDEKLVSNTLQNAGLFEDFANSFLVFGTNE